MQKHYTPIKETIEYLSKKYGKCKNILEIGPGYKPLPFATHYIDFVDLDLQGMTFIKLNICENRIQYPDDYFDFVYCRHTLEDIHNPDFLFSELKRVAKSGYIETPSPIVELCRGIDACSPFYRGYCHHRYLVWNNGKDNVLRFLAKYPLVEHINVSDNIRDFLVDPWYWNTYLMWDNNSDISCKLYYNDLDYKMNIYENLLSDAVNSSINNIKKTKQHIIEYLKHNSG